MKSIGCIFHTLPFQARHTWTTVALAIMEVTTAPALFGFGDASVKVLKDSSYLGAGPIVSPSGRVFWWELPTAGSGQINTSTGIYKTETGDGSGAGDWPVYFPSDVSASGSVLVSGRVIVANNSGGFSLTNAIFENAQTRLAYYNSDIPTLTANTARNVGYGLYDSDGSVVFSVSNLQFGTTPQYAICRYSGGTITTLLRSGQTVIPGTEGTTFSLVQNPSVSGGVILFYGEGGGTRGIYQLKGGNITKVVESGTAMPDGSTPAIYSASSFLFSNRGEDVAVSFTESGSQAVWKRVGGKWTKVAGNATAIPDGVGNFFYYLEVAILNGRVAFIGGRSNSFAPPLQLGVYQEMPDGTLSTIINQDDDYGSGKIPYAFLATPGGRWWNGSTAAVLATGSGGLRAIVSATLPEMKKPEISISDPSGKPLVDGSTKKVSIGTVKVGKSGLAKKFTIKNSGATALSKLTLLKSGQNKAEFTLTPLGKTSLAPGKSAIFNVTFKPTKSGPREATIRIGSNDADENPFDIKLTGTGN